MQMLARTYLATKLLKLRRSMSPDNVVELGREALMITLVLCAPALISGIVVGLIVGLLQALTQVQEQTVAFVPKVIAMVLAISLALPWMLMQMAQYVTQLYARIPDTL